MSGWGLADIPPQDGRTVIVTGANSGLGLRSAVALAGRGARVLLACRDPQRGGRARDEVARTATGPDPELVALDLASLTSVREAADDVAARLGDAGLDVLVNNAGVMASPKATTADGFERQLGTNHLGHFALTGLLLPALLAADSPRVVTVTSFLHRTGRIRVDDLDLDRGYSRWGAYGQSKLANALFGLELHRRADAHGAGLASLLAHPGYADTHLQSSGPGEGAGLLARVQPAVFGLANRLVAQSDAAGALPQLRAATDPAASGGEVYGPGGPLELRGAPKRVGLSKSAQDAGVAAALWERSEERTGVTYPWPVQ